MSFKCGIIGLPNVGKSTLFNALTAAQQAEVANYPFCTIEPNVGVVNLPDLRLAHLAEIAKPKQVIPAIVEFVDIAGLVQGASKGEGLGNKFLANIRETQAIAHVVRCFENENIVHVNGRIDPIRDLEIIEMELIFADLEAIGRALIKVGKTVKTGDKIAKQNLNLLEKARDWLNQGNKLNKLQLDEAATFLDELFLLTKKPTLYIANVLEGGFINNPHLSALQSYAKQEEAEVIPVCALIEQEIANIPAAERQFFLQELGMEEAGLSRVAKAGYQLLGLQTYFTAGPKEVRAWTIPQGTTAKVAAGVIHSDIARGFICAEVIAFDDYVKFNGEQGAKEKGCLRLEGKDYVMRDGDVVHFRFNV